MSEVLEFIGRPSIRIGVGAIFLILAIAAFATGGRGIITGVVLIVAGGHSVWRGFTMWQAQRS